MASQFPQPFEAFEPFSGWALLQREARYKKRIGSSMDEIRAFYDALRPRMEEMVEYLNARSLDNLSEEDSRLLNLALAWMDASRSIEVLGTPDIRYGLPADRFKIQDVAAI